MFEHSEIPFTIHLMAWHTCFVHHKNLSSWQEETETATEETCSSYDEEFHRRWEMEERDGKYTSENDLAKAKPAWKNSGMSWEEVLIWT